MILQKKNIHMVDFIAQDDNLLSKEECNNIINWTKKNKELKNAKYDFAGYQFVELMEYPHMGGNFHRDLSPKPLQPIKRAIDQLLDLYQKKYPVVGRTHMDGWSLEHVRFQWWKPGKFYNCFHSEHMRTAPHRVLVFLIYLSDNNCSTLFTYYDDVKIKAGRGILFPAYFTHTHSGSECQDKLDKYMLTGYFSFERYYFND